ncbi:hypothetical protein MTO96_021566 [Rhipicephalus appendiculatus]
MEAHDAGRDWGATPTKDDTDPQGHKTPTNEADDTCGRDQTWPKEAGAVYEGSRRRRHTGTDDGDEGSRRRRHRRVDDIDDGSRRRRQRRADDIDEGSRRRRHRRADGGDDERIRRHWQGWTDDIDEGMSRQWQRWLYDTEEIRRLQWQQWYDYMAERCGHPSDLLERTSIHIQAVKCPYMASLPARPRTP